MAGDVHVHGPGQRRIARGAELHGGHVDDVVEPRQRLHGAPVEQVACDRLDAGLLEPGAGRSVREARHADDALVGRRPLGHARERRPHLAGDAEHEDVAVDAGEVGDQLRRRLGHEVLERGDALEAVGQARRAVMRLSRGRPARGAPVGAAGIGRMAAKSMSAATAKPGQASEPSASRAAVDAQARRARRIARRDRDGRARRRPAPSPARTTCRR